MGKLMVLSQGLSSLQGYSSSACLLRLIANRLVHAQSSLVETMATLATACGTSKKQKIGLC